MLREMEQSKSFSKKLYIHRQRGLDIHDQKVFVIKIGKW